MIKDAINSIESQLKEKLKEIRLKFQHGGNKGTSLEGDLRAFLRKHIPNRYSVGHGEVIDSLGSRSGQVDLVIFDEDHPINFEEGDPGLFFVEGVVAAGESKAMLTSDELSKSLLGASKFKKLIKWNTKGSQILATQKEDMERFVRCPPWFLVAFESQLSLTTIRERIESRGDLGLGGGEALFILGKGWVVNLGDGDSALKNLAPADSAGRGWTSRESDSVLFDMLTWLSLVSPRTIRSEPILQRYLVTQR